MRGVRVRVALHVRVLVGATNSVKEMGEGACFPFFHSHSWLQKHTTLPLFFNTMPLDYFILCSNTAATSAL